MTKRLGAKVKEIGQTLMGMRSQPVRQQGTWLRRVVSGWMNYHAIPTNSTAISRFRDLVVEAWHRALRRRSQMAKSLTWARMRALAKAWIAPARVLHPYPNRSQLVRT